MSLFEERSVDVTDMLGRRLRLTPASAIRIRPVRWAWEDRMPAGALTLIPGREGVGKSLFLVWLTARVTRGELPGIHQGTPKPVIYAATEDSWEYTIAPRLVAAGADMDFVFRVEVVEDDDAVVPLTLPVDCGRLTAEIQRIGAAMLALDPLMSVIAPGIDTHRDRELRTALEPLVGLGDATGCAIAGLAHFNKSASSDPMNLITGSRAFGSVTRAVLAAARDPDREDDSYVLSQEKNNLGRLGLPSLSYVIDGAVVDSQEGPAHVSGGCGSPGSPTGASATSSPTAATPRSGPSGTAPPSSSATTSPARAARLPRARSSRPA
jgi:AAA domain